MKKRYVAPKIEEIVFDLADIITHSNATSDGETVVDPWERGERLFIPNND